MILNMFYVMSSAEDVKQWNDLPRPVYDIGALVRPRSALMVQYIKPGSIVVPGLSG